MTNFDASLKRVSFSSATTGTSAAVSAPDQLALDEDIPDMLNTALKALDDVFPDGTLVDYLYEEPSLHNSESSDDMFADLVPSTVTEAAEGDKQCTTKPVLPTKRASRKRAATTHSKTSPAASKVSKLEATELVVEPKPNESKQQALRRVKNNIASKVFRSKRKNKLEDLITREEELIKENRLLGKDLAMVTAVVAQLKQGLIANCNARTQHRPLATAEH